MSRRRALIVVFFLIFACSCSHSGRTKAVPAADVAVDLPREREQPALRILDYANMAENTALSPWFREYLANGAAGLESQRLYQDSYLFISSIRSAKKPVIDRWVANYEPERDFPRLVAERIQKRLHRDLPGIPPDTLYGPNYEKTIRAAYQYGFWGVERLGDTWVYASPVTEDEDAPAGNPLYWGFMLFGVPRETLEIQVLELLSRIGGAATGGGRAATREQNAAFESVKQRFFEQF